MNPSSCIVIIGNEILSGRTQDANTPYIARRLAQLGISLNEVRIIPDRHDAIISTVSEVRARYDYVFTTGGIGPTHDDITSSCIADAFGVPCEIHPASFALLEEHFTPAGFNAARQRMAMLPRGAEPIANRVSVAPGFRIGNVYVMAGVPEIARAMFEEIASSLKTGQPIKSCSWFALNLREGELAQELKALQEALPTLEIGSYPFYNAQGRGVTLIAKGTDESALAHANEGLPALIRTLGFIPMQGDPTAPAAQP